MSATAVDRVKSAHDATAGTATGDGGPINVPQVPKARQKTAAQLGVALAEIDYQRNVISLDLLNTFPELSWQGTKADFKDIAFANAVRLHGGMNPSFFAGTAVEDAAAKVLRGD